MAKIDDAMFKIPGFPGYTGNAPTTELEYNSLQWHGEWSPSKPTWSQVQDELNKILLQEVKAEARTLIAKTDWAMLPDVGISNVADYETYRSALREIIKNPMLNPQYPTAPEPIWI